MPKKWRKCFGRVSGQQPKQGLLILSRKKDEEIVIGEGITIRVLEICGDKVRIGLTAPEAVVIMRGELVAAKKENKEHGLER
ncbi:carbon storage regulator [bacterium]|nr:carbon storage regulator [bacterium]